MNIIFREYGRWTDTGERTFRAVISVLGDAQQLLWTGIGSTFPNPFDPDNPDIQTTEAYGCLAAGVYSWEYRDDAHNGEPGLNINNNALLDAIAKNPNQNGQPVIDHVDIHAAWNDVWRGSAGCPTVVKPQWDHFLEIVRVGQHGSLEIYRPNEGLI